jgi:hypothetical protein
VPSPQDTLQVIRGIGGTEVVFKRRVDFLELGEFRLPNFEIEVGAWIMVFRSMVFWGWTFW